ncbi:hypothetical protein GYMLUDRAFT_955129 [Collybiopsis luxurians FD-317 M1]|nr:hypothetical protein GYMLUDRAFT_955129 [Collybiopsis luxurians FD-317 M1]
MSKVSSTTTGGADEGKYLLTWEKLENMEVMVRDIETKASKSSFCPRGNGILNRYSLTDRIAGYRVNAEKTNRRTI